ncbi:HPF/RaiA family ribosome-associated protein [Actinokineospora auranticolor]|uniref:Sigma 54 modulation/S30EA-like ribosomal protein n=1 Tax=Actinokineospora auranticolor TaxID=155976 RepID=A0A2S6GIR7_9PSEU|nr:hypothetical protein [Actinokineospora auranticolor]PPK65109.1 hypothetical protein CLV40_116152 [Actinokineospora auranticolor]
MTHPRSPDIVHSGHTVLGAHVPATISARLRLGNGFTAAERPGIVKRLSSLDHALGAYDVSTVELELSTKDRDLPGQATTLQCRLAGRPRLVATSSQRTRTAALIEVRDNLRRQLDDLKARTAPQHARHRHGASPLYWG